MIMTWRWFGSKKDTITLDYIKQIPGIKGIVWSLYDIPVGDVWDLKSISNTVGEIKDAGFNADVVESVNVHEDIKLGLKTRDLYINNYIKTIENLAKFGVKVICYNFMPIFDWTRTNLSHFSKDGSNSLYYESDFLKNKSVDDMVKHIEKSNKNDMPGWEKDRLVKIKKLFKEYENVTANDLFNNLEYFLKKIIPICHKLGIKMAIHPDDPPWPIFNLPRIVSTKQQIEKIINIIDLPENGITLCTGSLGASSDNLLINMINDFADRIHFTHIRNLKRFDNGDFKEVSHREEDGDIKVVNIIKEYKKINFKGYVRPDHGRHLWDEHKTCIPGYGLYDRALGVMYMLGVWDSLKGVENND